MIIKVCGITRQEQLNEIEKIADFVGFIYYNKSKRCVKKAPVSNLTKRVGVFVNATKEEIEETIERDCLDIIQLHGSETASFIKDLASKTQIMKAFGINDTFNFNDLVDYEGIVDYYLFDTYSPNHGGTGKSFNWELLQSYQLATPFFLSGGIRPESLSSLIEFEHTSFCGIDLNSGFESQAGIKDIEKLKIFCDDYRTNK